MSVASDGRWRCESRGQVRGGGGGGGSSAIVLLIIIIIIGGGKEYVLGVNSARVEEVSPNPKSYQKKVFLGKISKKWG